MSQRIVLIVAADENNAIGKNNQLPWHIPEDFDIFKKRTATKPVVMGRKTWQSLPKKPLPNRKNVILTTQLKFQAEGASIVHSTNEVLDLLKQEDEIMIIGGAEIYREFLPCATDIFLSRIHIKTENPDAFFPQFNQNQEWEEIESETIKNIQSKNNGITFDFFHYVKKSFQAA